MTNDATSPDKIFETSTANVCLQRDLYTLPGDTPEQRMLIEKFYAENYEAHYDRVYQILTDPKKRQLTEEERQLIISIVVTMFYRTTKWINQHNEFIGRVLEQGYQLAQEIGKNYILLDGEKISFEGKTVDQLRKELKTENRPGYVLTQLQLALRLIESRIANDGIQVGKLVDDGVEFITSDNPVSYYRSDDSKPVPFDPNNIMELPLDNKHVLMLMPFAANEDKDIRNYISRVPYSGGICSTQKLTSNHNQFLNSERFLIGTDNALRDYLRTKEATEKSLTADELKGLKSYDDILKKAKDFGLL